jgi:hypothetical protein
MAGTLDTRANGSLSRKPLLNGNGKAVAVIPTTESRRKKSTFSAMLIQNLLRYETIQLKPLNHVTNQLF